MTTDTFDANQCVHPDRVRLALRTLPDLEQARRVAEVFKLLGDPTRARLLYALLDAGELCVCDLAAAIGASETTVSHSLRLLRSSEVVIGRRVGRNIYYRLSDDHVRVLLETTRQHVVHGSLVDPALGDRSLAETEGVA